MNGKERIAATLAHSEPDRVPYDLAGTTVSSITRIAYSRAMHFRNLPDDILTDEIDPVQQIVTPSEENLIKLNVDTRRIGAPRIMNYQDSRKIIDKTVEVVDFYGCRWQFNEGKDLYFNQVSYVLEKYDSLSESIEYLSRVKWDEYRTALWQALDEQIRHIGDYCCVADRNTAGLTENSLRIRGYEKWYMDTILDPSGVEGLLDIIVEDKINYWDALIDWALSTGNADKMLVASECDDLGSQTGLILDAEMLRKIVIPRLRAIFTHIKKRLPEVKIFMHSCGAIRPIIPDLIEAGLDILNPVQFTATGMELKGLKKDFGDVLTFWGGGVDTQSTLNKGKPDQVRDEVKKILDIMAPGGGFVFTPVHNIQNDVPPENFWAVWDTLQEYGKY